MAKLSDLIISKVRVKLLKVFLTQPKEMYYVRQLTRLVKEEINAIRRELEHLKTIGLLQSEKRGNRLYYSVKTSYALYSELTSLVAKSTGIGKYIIKNRNKIGFVKYAFISHRLAQSTPHTDDDVDLLIVGKLIMPQVDKMVKSLEKMTNSEINYSCMTEDEFNYRKSHRDEFIIKALLQPKVTLIGDETKIILQ